MSRLRNKVSGYEPQPDILMKHRPVILSTWTPTLGGRARDSESWPTSLATIPTIVSQGLMLPTRSTGSAGSTYFWGWRATTASTAATAATCSTATTATTLSATGQGT